MTEATFTCRHCGAVSSHPMDVRNRFCGRCHVYDTDPDGFYLWTVYDSPTDYPGQFVAREWRVYPAPDEATATGNVIAAEGHFTIIDAMQRRGLTFLDRQPDDEPHIVGSWI